MKNGEKAEKWIAEYDGILYGGNIVKAYRKKFAVECLKAVEELQMPGVVFSIEQIEREKQAVRDCQKQKANKKKKC